MDPNSSKKKKSYQKANPLELIRDSGRASLGTVGDELIKPMAGDFMDQIFGPRKRHFSAEFSPGESVEMEEMMSGQREKTAEAQKQLVLERRLREEEQVYVEKRTNELRLQIRAIHEEVIKLAKATPELSREIEIAAIQVPIEASVYELNFLQHLFEFIKSFREKIEDACVWLSTCNRRARKKNRWGANYGKYGAKYLLSGEHYLTRSAG